MPKQKVTVEVVTPSWKWCNLQSSRNPKCKTDECCRFCREVKKRGDAPRYYCLLFNVELTAKSGSIEKTCLCTSGWGKNRIIDLMQSPIVDSSDMTIKPKDLKQYITKAIKKVIKDRKSVV